MATFPTAANSRLKEYNSDSYDATSNPYGMADGGHRENFPMATDDVSVMGEFVADTGSEVQTAAEQVAQNLTASNDARDLARDWASKTPDQIVADGLYSSRHYASKADISAAQAATFEPANFVRRDGTQAMTGPLPLFAGTTQRGGLNLPQRGSAPSVPANGDFWSLATGLWGYFGGVARQFYDTTSLPAPTNAELDAGTNALRKAFSVADIIRAVAARFVRFDTPQALSLAQQNQARLNIDAAPRKQVVASFTGNGSSLFYLTPEMIIDNPVIDYVVSSGSVLISARIGTASGYIGGASDYFYNAFQVLGNNSSASFQQARSTLGLGSDVMSGTLVVSPVGLRSRASGIINSSGNRLDVIGTSTAVGDRVVIMNSDGNPLPNGAGIIFYGSKRT